ncbi:trehalose 6-phosphate synthase /trehalose 6-phosphatase [Metschnikowia aff. pulcherrima]|uniref:Trehalose 6-phosphate synthase /trehalose 6-phosphatase n=1 Tax=Metschnikowia aff. pulcherrima TaxID=2163413 RepID=A0A4P6XUY6_9ASCO|nr:trehalose 6-phosphate synthase /trehalose 6-phosphatase [Metschnikowia aff. pulcherrima]
MLGTVYDELHAFAGDGKLAQPQDYAHDEKLKLSGRILSVVTSLPTKISKLVDNDTCEPYWDVEAVRGQLALYSLLFYLQQQTDWETHIVGWTGEFVNKTDEKSDLSAENIENDPLYLDEDDKSDIEQKIRKATKSENVHPVWLLRRDQSRWRKYAENVIWAVFHYIQDQLAAREDGKDWYDYVKFNEAYFQKIKAIYKPGDIIWIHDYYLLLLPQLLRMEFPDAFIGLYIHAPFPSSEYFRCLPKRVQLLDGMLGADKIGFQNESFTRHFVSCCARIMGYEVTKNSVLVYGTTISVEPLPIGIDTNRLEHDAFSSELGVDEKVKALRKCYPDKKIIIGRDRLDLVRGVPQKLQAFEMFLHMYPEWRQKVVLIQVSSPGYSNDSKVEKKVLELVSLINSRYGNFDHTPILHYQIRINRDEYLALLRVADLALTTSVRDGMNTTSLEFVVCQKKKKSPLILSEFTGTASVLQDAILVNPWDSVGVARTINECLSMSESEKAKLEDTLYKKVASNSIQSWTSTFLEHLIDHSAKIHETHLTPTLNRPRLLKAYEKAERRLFLFDYDGTLTPIVKDPAAAIPSHKLLQIVDKLTQDPKNQFWIISGRDQAFLEKWWGAKNVGLSAEHGCFMRDVGELKWYNLAETMDMSWQIKVEEVFNRFTEETPGSNVEKKKVALTWHYRRSDPELGQFQADKCLQELKASIGKDYEVEIMSGKANIEVRPRFVNKGEIVKRLVLCPHGAKQQPQVIKLDQNATPANELPDFMLCLGDDVTDEDMFGSLKEIEAQWHLKELPKNEAGSYGVYPVLVGPAAKKTTATAHLNNPLQVIETLGLLSGHVSLFESAGSVDLDDRGHITNSESSERSKLRAAEMKRGSSSRGSSSRGSTK